ncbi:hypothetical protein [Maricaulis sp.]|uniref:hypothetical protein n=1 Tax=Maricaulis sp. TaxID=1486257 RepID=UPI003A911E08
MKKLRSLFAVTALAGVLLGAPAQAWVQDTIAGGEETAPSIEARALADQLLAVLLATGADADAATLEVALINALIAADQSSDIEAEALRLVSAETGIATFRAAADAVLARLPDTVDGFVATAEFTGGLPAGVGDLVLPGTPPETRGGGSDY